MGKGKKKFITQPGPTLRLVNRPVNDPNDPNQTMFQVVQKPMHNREKEEEMVNLAEIIQKKLNVGDYTVVTSKATSKPKSLTKPTSSIPAEVAQHMKGRSDLWINQLYAMKKAKMAEEEEEVEIEEYEDNDDGEDGDEDDWESDNEEEEGDNQFKQQKPNETVDFRTLKFHPSIKQRRYDEEGLPIDEGYDYSQHIIQGEVKADGELVVEYYVKPTEVHLQTVDMDYQPEDMTPEQREVFEALQYDGQEPLYEELEDDFVTLANGGEDCIIQKPSLPSQPTAKPKEVHFPQKLEQREESESESEDIDVDSEAEREFEREMAKYEDNSASAEEEEQIPDRKLNKIIDDHLIGMQHKKGLKLPQDEQEELKQERELLLLKEKDYLAYLMKKYPETDPNEFYVPKDVPKLTLEQDIALQNYLAKDHSSSEEEEPVDTTEVETIVSRAFEQSQLSKISPEELNIIKWQAFKKKKQPKPQSKEDQKQERDQLKAKQRELEVATLEKVVRDRGETSQEKKLRKQLIKQLKKNKKEKKQAFKETFKGVTKQHKQVSQLNRENQLVGVVKVG